MNLELDGSAAFVAGSSRGIGLAIARAFLREGARVVITGRDPTALRETERVLHSDGASSTDRVLAIAGDLRDESAIRTALDRTVITFGRLDHVVANIGSGRSAAGWGASAQDWHMALETNLLSGVTLGGLALTHLAGRGGGSLTFIASIAGVEAIQAPVSYSAAKAAIIAAMKSYARLAGTHGVRVNAVAPGNVLFPGGTWERQLTERRQEVEAYIATEVPLKRFGRPEEIADAVVFLASARAAFITGTCLVADGGQTRSF